MAFELYGGQESLPFLNKLQSALAGLPLIGDPAPTKVIALAHYSRDGGVLAFENEHKFSWTNKVAAQANIIGDLTGLLGRQYRSICLIRLGIGANYKPRIYSAGVMEEYAIDIAVAQGEFAQLPITYHSVSGLYI